GQGDAGTLRGGASSRISPSPPLPLVDAPVRRIVSLAPSVTEILFELGLGEKVVGVTRYCDYPPEAKSREKVGGYLDVNYEAVVALQPDLVIHITQHEEARDRLHELGIATLAVDHSRVDGIVNSINSIGKACGVAAVSRAYVKDLKARLSRVVSGYNFNFTPRVLVAVGRSLEPGASGEIYVSGRDGFYDDLIRLAGGENAYSDETLKFPALSAEGIARIDPDVILEMIPDLGPDEDMPALLSRWNDIPGLRAARTGRIYILGEDYVVIPGPRFVTLLEEMTALIHNEPK
ncbi:MAG: helical backbone metal receptor, partial [bacterium]|nr:helical backbone metal receptor [bacterium]